MNNTAVKLQEILNFLIDVERVFSQHCEFLEFENEIKIHIKHLEELIKKSDDYYKSPDFQNNEVENIRNLLFIVLEIIKIISSF